MSNLIRTEAVTVEIQAAAGDGTRPPRISILGYTGGEMTVGSYGPVVLELNGMETPASLPIIAEHQTDLDSLLGTGTASKREGKLFIDGILSRANPLVEKIVAMNQDGVAFSASIGAMPIEREFIQPGQSITVNRQKITAGKNGLNLITRSVLREISLVAVAADAATNVSISAALKGKTMSETNANTETTLTAADVQADLRAAAIAEDSRIKSIQRICGSHPAYDETQAAKVDEIRATAISEGWSTRKADVAVIKATLPKGPTIRASSCDLPGNENHEVMQAALLCHLGYENIAAKSFGDRTTQTARDLRLNSLHDILRCALHHAGQDVPHGRTDMIKASMSTNLSG